MNRTRLAIALLMLLSIPIGSCGSSGDECDKCSSDGDCKAGLFCTSFSDGSQRCGSGVGATSCRTR